MHRITLPLVLATLALRRRPPLLLDLKEGTVGMRTSRDAMSFDARRAGELLLIDQHHGWPVRPDGAEMTDLSSG